MTPSLHATLRELPTRLLVVVEQLRAGPASWIHGDAHLDNTLWRSDGSAVVLDWCGATIGPPAVDLARCLTEGLDTGSRAERAEVVLGHYTRELATCDVEGTGISASREALGRGVLVLLQSAVAWAGRPETSEPTGRMSALRENMLRSACAWLSPAHDLA